MSGPRGGGQGERKHFENLRNTQGSPVMRLKYFLTALMLVSVVTSLAGAEKKRGGNPWENSVVILDVTARQYDFQQPWTRKTRNLQKTGVVISAHEILTTADDMSDVTLVRIQKGGR